MSSNLVQYGEFKFPFSIVRQQEEFGFTVADIAAPPRRLLLQAQLHTPVVAPGIDKNRLKAYPSPAELLSGLSKLENPLSVTKRSLLRFLAFFLICEDPQRRLDARPVSTLAHQVSLVKHVLDHDSLRRVLIADEVGLGKTVVTGLLLKELFESQSRLRVLYFAPARLVTNVRREFDLLQLGFRQWSAMNSDARLSDPRIIASIHRAIYKEHREKLLATDPWDVLVVDECHHLSDWADGGGDPKEKFKLIRDLIARQREDGRVIFLSGTPHQGHTSRFENLIDLLRQKDEPKKAIEGRVIYRTKDDIVDWDGKLLFPRREVHQPLVVDLGPTYRAWIESIHSFFQPEKGESEKNESWKRAAGWRCAQALQWATSSPQAGLGYLVRQAIRAGWNDTDPVLVQCILAMRPYRNGPLDESATSMFKRMEREVKQQIENADIDDLEDELDFVNPRDDRYGLSKILEEGLQVLREAGNAKWELLRREIIDKSGHEKIVLFAQPIETVTALSRFLEVEIGSKPALIIGGQSDEERDRQVRSFTRTDGPRYLVSSRAGGEGINLQVARRLVHLDVPWNPMEMEQRVGRVHRFGSRKTILVDTIVVKDSREADAYRVAREKLRLIATTMVEPEKFETLFNRVMALMPPEELQDVLINHATAPLTHADQESLSRMIQNGYERWRAFDQRFSDQQRLIKNQDAGAASWNHVLKFIERTQGKIERLDGFVSERFEISDGVALPSHQEIEVIRVGDQGPFAIGDLGGMPIYGQNNTKASQLGINLDFMLDLLHQAAFPEKQAGPGAVSWPSGVSLPSCVSGSVFAVLAVVRSGLQQRPDTGWSELNSTLHIQIVNDDSEVVDINRADLLLLMDGLLNASGQKKLSEHSFVKNLTQAEENLVRKLQRPTDEEIQHGIRYAVFPILACTVTHRSSPLSVKTNSLSSLEFIDEELDMNVELELLQKPDESDNPTTEWGEALGLDGPQASWKALSIRQPHAEAIMRGVKTTEYRTESNNVRGRILIYSSQTRSSEEDEEEMMVDYQIDDVRCEDLPRGRVIGSVDLYDSNGGEWYLRDPIRAALMFAPQSHPQPKWFHPFRGDAP